MRTSVFSSPSPCVEVASAAWPARFASIRPARLEFWKQEFCDILEGWSFGAVMLVVAVIRPEVVMSRLGIGTSKRKISSRSSRSLEL